MGTSYEDREIFKLQKGSIYINLYNNYFSAHDRSIVGIIFHRNPKNGQFSLITLAHDSLKYWNV